MSRDSVCSVGTQLRTGRFRVRIAAGIPDRPLGLQEVEAARISRQMAHEGGKVVSPANPPPLPSGDISGTHFC